MIIWVLSYLASVLAVTSIVAYTLGRFGLDERFSAQAAIFIGVAWPLMVPLGALSLLVTAAARAGFRRSGGAPK